MGKKQIDIHISKNEIFTYSHQEDGIDGVIVPLDDSGCADGIVEVIQDRELRIKLVENCQKRDYSSKDEVEKLYKLMGD